MDTLPQDQLYHSYVIVGTPDMMTSTCKCTIVLPTHWYTELSEHFPDGIEVKTFYNKFLANVTAADRQALQEVFTWWRHHVQEWRRNVESLLWAAGANPTGPDAGHPYQM